MKKQFVLFVSSKDNIINGVLYDRTNQDVAQLSEKEIKSLNEFKKDLEIVDIDEQREELITLEKKDPKGKPESYKAIICAQPYLIPKDKIPKDALKIGLDTPEKFQKHFNLYEIVICNYNENLKDKTDKNSKNGDSGEKIPLYAYN